ncbi:cadherin-like beta sandwich domain-containing protein [Clostridium sp. C2-6-12]|uniref:N-acetylmuramoyl-L-alanine amidase family protein n=1 Tax=Clostridium sp. C2-6-12 TaxID=2698832 RepID=UPI00136EB028|nr:cadherin-like beta sandwich domain-containing protein [Clostridium sp. C2-6-12]
MHNKIKILIATSLVLGAVSGILPANDFGLGTTKVYASSHHHYDDDDEFDDIAYLDGIYLSEGNISFDKDETEYNVNVKKDTSEIYVKAKPEYDDYLVDINGYSVERKNDYEKKIKLDEGNNTIKIEVQSDDDKKTYTLNVYRGDTLNTNGATGTNVTTGAAAQTFEIKNPTKKFNEWNRIDGKLKYLDGTGQVLKNMWWFDKNTGINYYLKEDGARATGWFQDNGKWYYFNENGEMKTGWVCLNSNWYYLSKSGVMKMGWLEDSDGNWYYLNGDGSMKTGWLQETDGNWYYLDSTGKMIKNSNVNGYQLSEKGILTN